MKRFWTPLVILTAVAMIAAAWFGMQRISAARSAALKEQAARTRSSAVAVQTARVKRADMLNVLTFNGDIEALRTVQLQPKVSGRLLKLELEDGTPVEEGVRVKKGMVLAKIDDREYHAVRANALASKHVAAGALTASQATLAQKKADLASSQAATASSQANYDDKERELKRQENLVAKGASATQTLDLARTAFAQAAADLKRCRADEASAAAGIASAEAAIKQAEAAVEQAEAKLEEAQLNLDETCLYSPMDGVVSIRHADPGAMVSSSTPIVTIVSMDVVKIILSVPVNHLDKVIPGRTAAVLHPATDPDRTVECTVGKIYPAVDMVTRTAKVEIRIENPREDGKERRLLRAGMYASVDLLLDEHRNAVVVEQDLPTRVLEKNIVFVCRGDTVEAREVTLGLRHQGMVEVLSGLEEGDEVVVSGRHRLTDGSRIKRVEDTGK